MLKFKPKPIHTVNRRKAVTKRRLSLVGLIVNGNYTHPINTNFNYSYVFGRIVINYNSITITF